MNRIQFMTELAAHSTARKENDKAHTGSVYGTETLG